MVSSYVYREYAWGFHTIFGTIETGREVSGEEAALTANPVQTTGISGVKWGCCKGAVDAGIPLQYSAFPHGRALSSAG